ncbi:hypothetical protein FACS1894204_03510 [Synergistales bacterium]|nr:hypothetical protein FACS1894204_03510 [Synergistales bacterium]
MILQNKDDFFFHTRTRRPPLDRVNALLSFIYTLLGNDIAAALTAVGLDSFVGFLHRDRPGRRSLALDLLEELRAPLKYIRNKSAIQKINFVSKNQSSSICLSAI